VHTLTLAIPRYRVWNFAWARRIAANIANLPEFCEGNGTISGSRRLPRGIRRAQPRVFAGGVDEKLLASCQSHFGDADVVPSISKSRPATSRNILSYRFLLTLNFILRFTDLGAMIKQYNQF